MFSRFAPWECGEFFVCVHCHRPTFETSHETRHACRYDSDAAGVWPHTEYGRAAELCDECAQYILVCGYCGTHREYSNPAEFFNFDNPADTVCAECRAEIAAATNNGGAL